jgi:hypothetical protein
MPRIFDASQLTKDLNSRTIYTNVLVQQEAVKLGLKNRVQVVNGGTSASDYTQNIAEGAIDTTPAQAAAALASVPSVAAAAAAAPPPEPITSITARYIKFSVTAVRTAGQDPAVAGFQLLLDGSVVAFNAGRTVRMVDYTTNAALSDTGSTPASFINGYLTSNKAFPFLPTVPAVSLEAPRSILVDNTTNITFDAFKLAVADSSGRDPIRWIIETSTDGTTYTTVDDQTAADVNYTRPSNYSLIATAFTPSIITA